jgi:hypothetical protein
MAKIPLPSAGQPLDLSYVYQLANAVNDLSSKVVSSDKRYLSVDTDSALTQNLKVGDARIIAGYVTVVNNADVELNLEKEFSYQYPADFKYDPIVLATPINIGDSSAGDSVSVTIKSNKNSIVTGIVRFSRSGTASVGVNLLIIGVPN